MIGNPTAGRFAWLMKREQLVHGKGSAALGPGHRVPPPGTDARPAGSPAIRFFQGAVIAQVLLILAQPVLIGLFLSGGDSSKLDAHEMVGSAVGAAGIFVVIAAVVLWSVLLLVAEVVQLTMGYDRHLGIHVPLGVALAIAASSLYTWAFRPHGVDRR
jgi:hypothetical protein